MTDINLDIIIVIGNSPDSNQLCDLIFNTGLSQLIVEFTYIHGNVLDLLLTSIEENILSLEVQSSPSLSSNYYDITFTMVTIHKPPSKFIPYYSFNCDYSGLYFMLTLQVGFNP